MLINILLFSVFILDYLATSISVVPRALALVPELLSGVAIVMLFAAIVRKYKPQIGPGYMFLFIFVFLIFFVSVIANAVQPGAVFAGLRTYVKYIPFFFLPIMIQVEEKQLSMHLKIILAYVLFQFPVSVYQRFIENPYVKTGDLVTGTFALSSGALTIISLSTVAVVLSAYYKNLISFRMALILFAILLVPPTINETTITLFLLPLTFIVPTVLFSKFSSDKKRLITMTVIGSISLVVFAASYNILYGDRWGGSITNIFTSSKGKDLTSFLMKKDASAKSDAKVEGEVGRFDSISLAFEYLIQYPTKIAMGVGIGNAGASFSDKFKGEYNSQYERMGGFITSLSHLLWETGVIGIFLVLILFMKIYFDAYSLITREDVYGVLALGWTVIILMFVITMVYQNFIPVNALGYLFWYLSGCLVAESYRSKNNNLVQANTIII